MDTEGEIATTIRATLAEHVKRDAASIQPDHALQADLGLDSMGIIELLHKLEQAFDLQIPDQDLEHLRTVGDIMAYVQRMAPSPTAREPVKSRRAARPSSSRNKSQR